ncbi:MAG: hypothetical protein AAF447_06545 [Myxococcota bacterium]
MQTLARGSFALSLILAIGCGDDGRVGGAADMAGDGVVAVDMPARTDSGIDAGQRDMAPGDLGSGEMGGSDLGADGPLTDAGNADLGGDAGAADLGAPDDGVMEMGAPDDGVMEMGAPDGGVMEMGAPDAGPMDLGTPDGGSGADLGPGGCSATAACPASDYCDFPAADVCGDGGGMGTCRPRPGICPLIFDPHCGCDDRTYDNDCSANASGTDTRSRGACPP